MILRFPLENVVKIIHHEKCTVRGSTKPIGDSVVIHT